MDFWRTVLVLFRRWYITVPAFLGSLALAVLAGSAVPATYQSDSVVVLTTPLTGGTESPLAKYPNSLTNPMLNFDRSLSLAGAILIQQLNSPETATALGLTPGGSVHYEVTNGSSNPELLESGPFLFIHATGPTPEAARRVTARLTEMVGEVLTQRQDALKAPAATHINVQVVVPTTAGHLLTDNPMRATAAALALAGIGCLTAVYGFDSLMTHRRRRRAARREERTPRTAVRPATASGREVIAAPPTREPVEAGG
ncbi:hypothetical protein GON03_07820 [Nocardioides sp. MAH-18]|uniref:Polysaccharide chain length determinant N-terminal domain-containing protein n=1 Tax=Nocardioides agri TaxID=2682843 RepID=A0A6L6XR87_9ACTN|nr:MULTISPECIES: hypothetical protein [unclassified Nocardioides]MBA2954225.1 hypothetical protein [Nocardioides sp. CGMCC 1.13656]MVQ49086.1 hypothetical protein [Nocardioides sp. MAH-18]